MYDLIVIGAGPAGSAAAITASRAGANVLLLERGHYPRQKVCGEFVSAESLQLVRWLLGDSSEWRSLLDQSVVIDRARLFIDNSRLETSLAPAAASIARFDLDTALWQSALAADVDARLKTTVHEIQANEHYVLATSAGPFRARSVLNASGRWSNLNGKHHPGTRDPKWLGLKAHFVEPEQTSSVDLYFFEGGYCGVQPVQMWRDKAQRQVNVCAMVSSRQTSSLLQVFALHHRLHERSLGWKQVTPTIATSPLLFLPPRPAEGRLLMAGDAAGFVDPFVGDGISLALRSGVLAAQSLQGFFAGDDSLDHAAAMYAQAYRSSLQPVFHASSKIRRLFSLPRPIRAGLLLLFENTPSLLPYLLTRTR